MRTHMEHHEKKYSHQCRLCSYSAGKEEEIAYHLIHHHSKRPPISKPPKVEKAAKELNRKKKYQHCSQCDYKCTDKSSLNWHIRKKHSIATTPSSTSPREAGLGEDGDGDKNELMPNSSPDNKIPKKQGFLLYQCDQCEYEINKKSNFENHRQFHFKKSAYQCSRCSYSVSVPIRLTYHLHHHHSAPDLAESDLSNQVFGENTRPKGKRVKRNRENEEINTNEEQLEDLNSVSERFQSNFSTDSAAEMTLQESSPSSDSKHKSPLRNFSSSLRNVTDHGANHHGDDAACPSANPEMVSSADVNLPPVELEPPIEPREFDAEERSCREQMAELEEALQSDLRSLENSSIQLMEREKQMQSLRTRVEIAKEHVETAEKRLKDVQPQKNVIKQRKREAVMRKMRAEFDLRTEQCKALEIALIAFDAVGEDHLENELAVEKRIKSLEDQLGEIAKELVILAEEEKALSKDLEKAEASHLAAFQSLSIPQTELEALESGWKADADSLNQMVDLSKGRIEAYYQLEKQLLDIQLGKKMEHLSKKKTSYLLSLKNLCAA